MGARQFVLAAAGFYLLLGCRSEPRAGRESRNEANRIEPATAAAVVAEPSPSEPIAPVPVAPEEDSAWVELGAALFASPVVSGDGQVSCQSCHEPEHGFADARSLSRPAGRLPMTKNTPTLLNVAHLQVFNWDGRFSSLEDHLDALIQNPLIQGTTWEGMAERLAASDEWSERFSRSFPDGVTAANAKAALLAYERSLVSPGAAFDRWLLGEPKALSDEAREGYALFKNRGCISCHQGALVGGNLFQRLGVIKPYYDAAAAALDANLGRFAVTGREEDRHVFRVPSLRNVAITAPYLHDGSLPTLETAVSAMATYQLGRALDGEQIDKIVAFLESLTGSVTEATP